MKKRQRIASENERKEQAKQANAGLLSLATLQPFDMQTHFMRRLVGLREMR